MSVRRLWQMMAASGFIYEDAHYLACDMEIDARAASRWLPSPLRLASPPTATVFTAWFPTTSFGSVYREAGIFLHVRHFGRRAVHSPWMIVDDDVALILGRELLGYPKKLGEIDFRLEGDRIEAVARRRGAELVSMRGTLGERVHPPPPFLGRPHRNVRTSLGLAVPKLVAFTPREHPIEVRKVALEVTIGSSDRDPLAELGFGGIRSAHLHRVNLAAAVPPIPVGVDSFGSSLRQLLRRSW